MKFKKKLVTMIAVMIATVLMMVACGESGNIDVNATVESSGITEKEKVEVVVTPEPTYDPTWDLPKEEREVIDIGEFYQFQSINPEKVVEINANEMIELLKHEAENPEQITLNTSINHYGGTGQWNGYTKENITVGIAVQNEEWTFLAVEAGTILVKTEDLKAAMVNTGVATVKVNPALDELPNEERETIARGEYQRFKEQSHVVYEIDKTLLEEVSKDTIEEVTTDKSVTVYDKLGYKVGYVRANATMFVKGGNEEWTLISRNKGVLFVRNEELEKGSVAVEPLNVLDEDYIREDGTKECLDFYSYLQISQETVEIDSEFETVPGGTRLEVSIFNSIPVYNKDGNEVGYTKPDLEIRIVGVGEEWCKVLLEDGDYYTKLADTLPACIVTEELNKTMYCNMSHIMDRVYVNKYPVDEYGNTIESIKRGDTVQVVGLTTDNWYKVKIDEEYGYVKAEYLTDDEIIVKTYRVEEIQEKIEAAFAATEMQKYVDYEFYLSQENHFHKVLFEYKLTEEEMDAQIQALVNEYLEAGYVYYTVFVDGAYVNDWQVWVNCYHASEGAKVPDTSVEQPNVPETPVVTPAPEPAPVVTYTEAEVISIIHNTLQEAGIQYYPDTDLYAKYPEYGLDGGMGWAECNFSLTDPQYNADELLFDLQYGNNQYYYIESLGISNGKLKLKVYYG